VAGAGARSHQDFKGEGKLPEVTEKQRTIRQNAALHKWLQEVADALNSAGLDMKTVLKEEVEIPWTGDSAKNHLWRPIQKVMQNIESTADAYTTDYTVICETITRHLGGKLGVTLPPWPDKNRTPQAMESYQEYRTK